MFEMFFCRFEVMRRIWGMEEEMNNGEVLIVEEGKRLRWYFSVLVMIVDVI